MTTTAEIASSAGDPRSLTALWLTSSLANVADGIVGITLVLVALSQSGAAGVAAVVAAMRLPAVVLGPILGVLVDTFSATRLMRLLSLARAAAWRFVGGDRHRPDGGGGPQWRWRR